MEEMKNLPLLGIEANKITFVSGPVIIEGDKVLLVKKKNSSTWQFPGGTCLEGENFQYTAIREAEEELGIKIKINGQPVVHALEVNGKLYILVHYKAEIISGEIKPQSEIEEYKWQEINQLEKIESFDNVRSALNYFVEK